MGNNSTTFAGGKQITKGKLARGDTEHRDPVSQPPPDGCVVFPGCRRDHCRGRRDIFAAALEHLTDESVKSPVPHYDRTSNTADPYQFGGNQVRPKRKLCADKAKDKVEPSYIMGQHSGARSGK